MFLYFTSLFCITILALILPGPDFFIVLRSSLRYGKLSGVLVSFGIALGTLVHVALVVILLDYLQDNFILVLRWVSLLGGFYLLYVAYECYCSYKNKSNLEEEQNNLVKVSKKYLFSAGLLCNLTNPKAIVYFISVLPQFILKCPLFVCNIGIILIEVLSTIVWFSFVSFIMGSSRVRNVFFRHMPKVEISLSVILSFFAIYLVYSFWKEFF